MTNPTLLDHLKAKRAELAQRQTIDLDVPGYGGDLVIRYKSIPLEQLNETLLKVTRAGSEKHVLEANADLLIRTCEGIYVRQSPDSPLEPLDPEASEPTTFSSGTLPELLGLTDVTTARQEVFAVFSPDGAQPLAIGRHSDAVITWLQGSSDEEEERLSDF